ncbi:hypothetical protein EVG20_g3248 [Dentipellis fragilis]|uniref:Uncharacterized protein n=1 Tax=Dentipellis fragilis TaxID=205917 RepID=A0A4Y9Z5W4_9AGAM|nr:hypothetical protein EVG20_g3248 [Dentipellis fragilis]
MVESIGKHTSEAHDTDVDHDLDVFEHSTGEKEWVRHASVTRALPALYQSSLTRDNAEDMSIWTMLRCASTMVNADQNIVYPSAMSSTVAFPSADDPKRKSNASVVSRQATALEVCDLVYGRTEPLDWAALEHFYEASAGAHVSAH